MKYSKILSFEAYVSEKMEKTKLSNKEKDLFEEDETLANKEGTIEDEEEAVSFEYETQDLWQNRQYFRSPYGKQKVGSTDRF